MASSPLSKTTGVTSVIAIFFCRVVFRHLLPPTSKFDNAEYLKTDELRKSSYCILQYYFIYVYEKNYQSFLKLFVPSGVPIILLPLIVVIEVISYLSRPISLSVRLFANMMAGHTMMKVFGSFVISLGVVGGWLPLSFSVALTGLEILLAFLQAYVFAILTCIYLNDALNLHH